jgi:hypothetical protein
MPGPEELGCHPPVIKTLLFVSKVAVCSTRGVVMLPVEVNVAAGCASARTTLHKAKSEAILVFISPSSWTKSFPPH